VRSSLVQRTLFVMALAVILGAGSAWAEDAPAVAAAPAGPSIDVTGFVDGYYGYNFNKPTSRINGLHTFDADDNSLTLSLAEIAFEKKPVDKSPVGFRIDLDFGPAAGITNAFEPSSQKDALKFLEQGYVSWLASPKVQLDFGKFVTPFGAEVIESKDNWNYTRSIQFGYAIPFYHAGLRGTINPSDKASIALFLVNGWNNVSDNNSDKSVAGQLTLKPSAKLTWINNIMVGKEASVPAAPAPDNRDTRVLYDTVLTLAPTEKVNFMANFDYGKEGNPKWWAISGYAKLVASPTVTFSPRVEYLDDTDGFMTLVSQKLTSFTWTSEVKLGGDLLTRLDLRYDHSDKEFFESDSGLKKGQFTATLGVVYAFGGKI
jgi:Putative beta-barrel porin-2, OmpL-like. bbp2